MTTPSNGGMVNFDYFLTKSYEPTVLQYRAMNLYMQTQQYSNQFQISCNGLMKVI